ncbi:MULTISPECIES: hypothetical protein [Pontibacillus]|uniref:DUF4083 domain-containing protein n=1 Tax=Pontibacillus chungwhensis TaxID=265426 RepID=A0ABY8V1R6_9BACI|nr:MULTISPECIES: hypothetical protein [Pontibacillus]MCD5322295.1 hypothetical protein [Pontibacillus sp. HN14]WIF99588.1 hypothetical protein QNI29_07995 [Pontibacillus chungwhensis]
MGKIISFYLINMVAALGIILGVVGIVLMLIRRVTQPRKELQEKVDHLEREVSVLQLELRKDP